METWTEIGVESTPSEVASFLGSGINGNFDREAQDPMILFVASFLGSGINGNNRIQ